jgi:hypothetical protein
MKESELISVQEPTEEDRAFAQFALLRHEASLLSSAWLRNVEIVRKAMLSAGLPISWLDANTLHAKRIQSVLKARP